MAFKNIKRKAKKAPRLSRDYDTASLGDEPKWDKMPLPADRKVAIMKTQAWYNYFHDSKDHRPFMVKYATEVLNFSRPRRQAIQEAPPYQFSSAAEKYVRMFYRGWVLNDAEKIKIEETLKTVEPVTREDKPEVLKPNVVSSSMLAALDAWEDDVILGKIEPFSIFDSQKVLEDTKGNIDKHVRPWVEARLADMQALKEKDPAVSEGYNLSMQKINKLLPIFEAMKNDVDTILATKVRVVKAKPMKVTAEKIAKKFKVMAESDEFKVKSVDPRGIIGARKVYMFDTKYRTLTVLEAADVSGFGGKGMGITGFDEAKSFKTKLRKPEDILSTIVSKSETQIKKTIDALTTKPSSTNGRTNENIILLRVIK
jgi:hypothetical protein